MTPSLDYKGFKLTPTQAEWVDLDPPSRIGLIFSKFAKYRRLQMNNILSKTLHTYESFWNSIIQTIVNWIAVAIQYLLLF